MHIEHAVFGWDHTLRTQYLDIALEVNKGAAAAQPWNPEMGSHAAELRGFFRDHATTLCEELGFPAGNRRYWFGVWSPGQVDENDSGWCPGFPHTHGWDGLSFAHVLQAPDGGGDLWIKPSDGGRAFIFPSDVGMTSVVGGYVSHGIRAITGTRPRVTMITAVYRKIEPKEEKWKTRKSSGATTRLTPG